VFNETSCVACHNLGGSGGAGSLRKNAVIMTPLATRNSAALPPDFLETFKVRTGLRSVTSSVLHRFGTSPDYPDWRSWILRTSFVEFTLRVAERNTPALFGAGLIDAIPDAVLEAREKATFPEFPAIHGRVSRLRDGTIGRFGWKGQTASLDDFVRTACAAELGLEAPGHHQSPDPSNPKDTSAELDLTEDDCRALVAYVASLPAPVRVEPPSRDAKVRWNAGGALFKTIGCATCHTPTLGDVDGLYSDLLLHDLGPANSGDGYYTPGDGGTPPPPLVVDGPDGTTEALSPEWRTTPLWGLRDSAPYMHDGKARTLEEAIGRHGGQAQAVQARFDALSGEQKMQLRKFLLSLAAPPDAEHLPSIPNRSRPPRPSGEAKAHQTSPPRASNVTVVGSGAF
jgi:cytochrome c553